MALMTIMLYVASLVMTHKDITQHLQCSENVCINKVTNETGVLALTIVDIVHYGRRNSSYIALTVKSRTYRLVNVVAVSKY